MRIEEIERKREQEETWVEEIESREKDRHRRERWEEMKGSKYNRWYKEVKGEGIPRYLKKGWRESKWRRVARFRLGSEVRESKYWKKEEKKICRICGGKKKHGNMCGKGVGSRRRWKVAGRKMWDGCWGMRGRERDG